MAITVQPITPDFAAEVGDVVLGKPLAADDLAAIRAAFTKYAVLVFPDQEFDDESQLDFARTSARSRPPCSRRARIRSCACTRTWPMSATSTPRTASSPPTTASDARISATHLAHGLLLQAAAGLLLDAARALDPADRRPDRVRRPARGLRRRAPPWLAGTIADRASAISRATSGCPVAIAARTSSGANLRTSAASPRSWHTLQTGEQDVERLPRLSGVVGEHRVDPFDPAEPVGRSPPLASPRPAAA